MTILNFVGGGTEVTEVGLLPISATLAFWVVQVIDAVRMTGNANRKISAMPVIQ